MARPIVLGNGEMHVGLNKFGLVHDFYFPYVGLENHSAGGNLQHRVGFWADGEISWLDDGSWTFSFSYLRTALIGRTIAKNDRLGLMVEFEDFVDADLNAFMRSIHVINKRRDEREVRLFMHQAFAIGDSRSYTDTAQYLPDSDALLHYRGRRAFLISGLHNDHTFDQHSIGLFGIEGREGTYRDADDGELSMGNVEHGQVDSTIRFTIKLDPLGSSRAYYWIAAGTSTREALLVDRRIREYGFMNRMHATAGWWYDWLQPALTAATKIDPKYRQSFVSSVMIVKSQIDKRGAIMASTDTTMLNYSRDAYAYCWPRDGAFVLWPLIRMGYKDEARRYFEFCREGLHPSGYLMHKYRADGALGSSWHPYVHEDGIVGAPIQEDETALTLFVFAQFYKMTRDGSLLDDFYESMVKPMANFMASYIDETTGLPKPTYDLWEEIYLTTTFTTATVYAGLHAAADLAEEQHDEGNAVRWRAAAEDVYAAAHKHLYNPERKAFYKGFIARGDEIEWKDTIDCSSLFGSFMFGLFDLDSLELKSTVETTREVFNITDDKVVGLPRYENDYYQRVSPGVTGNWWFITTLWLAQYYLETGNSDAAYRIIDWTNDHALASGVLSEQLSPLDESMVSVAPLTWTHAEYIATLLDTITEQG